MAMDHGWATAFAAFMAMREMEEEDRLNKQYVQEIADYSEQICNIVIDRMDMEGLDSVPGELGKGIPFVPLYCFGLVLQNQKRRSRMQQDAMKIFFKHLTLPFGQDQFVSAMESRRPLPGFSDKMVLSKGHAGDFWKELFRFFHKLDHEEDADEIIQLCTEIITRFAALGNPKEKISAQVCYDLMVAAHSQMKDAVNISDNEIDWMGIVSVQERRETMLSIYRSLMYRSGVLEDVSEQDHMDLFEILFLNSICDIVMMTKVPNATKLRMIVDSVNYVGANPNVDPAQYVRDIASQDGVGAMYHNMFSMSPTCGMFWNLMMVMGDKVGSSREVMGFVNHLLAVLLQVEQRLKDQYGDLGAVNIATRYTEHILEGMLRLVEE